VVLERSRRVCLHCYEKELLKEGSFMNMYAKTGAGLTDDQLSVFAGACRFFFSFVSRAGAFLCRDQIKSFLTSVRPPLVERIKRLH
jgi:hypothetical protein